MELNQLKQKYGPIGILINVVDRPTEISLLLESLRHQTYNLFNVFIIDDFSGTLLSNYHFFNCITNRLRFEGHKVHIMRTEFNYGVSKARQAIAERALQTDDYQLLCRVDDDSVCAPDFLEKLIAGIEAGFDLVGGTNPYFGGSGPKRESRHIGSIGNRVFLDEKGNYVLNNDDFGHQYLDEKIVPIHHFRSCCLYKSELHKRGVNYTPTRLSRSGFREEQLFSFRAILKGFKLCANTAAVSFHLATPSGGQRRWADSNDLIKLNEMIMKEETIEMVKQHGNFIEIYNQALNIKVNPPTMEELMRETNLAGRI